jgi:hypothetical protein
MQKIEDILTELLLSEDRIGVEEKFLIFLVMEPFIRQFRASGKSNMDILKLCRKIDEKRDDKQ